MRVLPDVTSYSVAQTPSALKWVGMEDIAVPITLSLEEGKSLTSAAKANIFVSLDSPNAKGIHMSRLYTIINQLAVREFNQETIEQLLNDVVESQSGIGLEAKIELTFDLLIKKNALLSNESGFQTYPISINAEKNEFKTFCELEVAIPYSSTCPCSASLARQLYADAIDQKFPGTQVNKNELMAWVQSQSGSVATPHSQRSFAYIQLSLGNNDWPDFHSLIVQLEKAIGTPVQTAVKRIDEQEFTRLNAENLMFCEDAARQLKSELERMSFVVDYRLKVEHQESLHAHNAVVIDHKNNAKNESN